MYLRENLDEYLHVRHSKGKKMEGKVVTYRCLAIINPE